MPNWSGGILTTRGQALQAKVDAGQTTLTFTKMKIGSGVLGSGQSLEDLTDLITPKQNIGISSISASGNITTLTGVITNAGITTGYQVRELGVFATDPTLGEILYSVTIDSAPDYLPPEGGAVAVSQEFNYKIAVSNAANVSATISTSGLVTVGMLQQHNHDGTGTNGPKLGSNALLDGAVTDLAIGNRTITDTVTAAAGANTVTNLLSMIGNMLKRITGKTTWWTPPATTLEAANTHITAATGAHAATAISLTPTGDVSAATVQAGIAELAAEKLAKANSLAGTIYHYRDIAAYSSASASITGTLKIMLPVGWVNSLMNLDIKGFNYATAATNWQATLGGQNANTTSTWLVPSAMLSPNCPFSSVRFGYDTAAGKCCILLGTTSTIWQYPKVLVDAMVGHTSPDTYGSGWSVSIITDETGITVSATPTVKTLATVEGTAPAGYGLGTAATDATGDWNNYKTTGYFKAENLTNAPTTGTGHWYWVEVIRSADTYVYQQAHGFGSASRVTWERTCNGGTWSGWTRITTSDIAVVKQSATTGDWNAIMTPGMYTVDGTITGQSNDAPSALSLYAYGQLVVTVTFSGVVQQTYYSHTHGTSGIGNQIATRQLYVGRWSTWKQIATTDLATAYDGGHSFTENGYQKLSNGFILQWGYRNNSDNPVTFPIAFPNACLNVGLTTVDGSQVDWTPIISAWTTTNFSLSSASYKFTWFAIGY